MSNESHLTASTLQTYFAAGRVVVLAIATTPECMLRVDPPHRRIELWTPAVGPEPDVTAMSRVSLDVEERDDGPWFVLAVDARDAHFEAYTLLAAVIDDLEAGRPFHVATSRSFASYRDLLAGRDRLSEERATGLLGELLLLEHLILAQGEGPALSSWLGPEAEEHDFALPDLDAEVKTTLSETRRHVIGTEQQLASTPGRPLWLVSIQLTRAGDARQGFGLPDVLGRIRAQLGSGAAPFAAHLQSMGWRDHDLELYRERYLLRTAPAAYLVDEAFPAVTRARIESVVPQPESVSAVSYRLDVSGLTAGMPPGALSGFVGRTMP